MKIFVGWPYDAKWVEAYAIPLIRTYSSEPYGLEVLTGQELKGQVINQGVKERIGRADAALFFTTRRGKDKNTGMWKTSDWVVDEIKHANSVGTRLVFEFREEGVEYPNKIHDERQYITFSSEDLPQCLVELGKVISGWRHLRYRVKLVPKDGAAGFVSNIAPRLYTGKYKCSFSVLRGGEVTHGPCDAKLKLEGDSVFMYPNIPADKLAADALMEVDVTMGDDLWAANRENFTTTFEVVLVKF